jgi:hypothetical protein
MSTTTLKTIHDWMHAFNRQAAPGSECREWQEFVAESYARYGMAPWDDRAEDVEPSQSFVDHWLDKLKGE